jgi:hypothetical protein
MTAYILTVLIGAPVLGLAIFAGLMSFSFHLGQQCR